MNIDKLKKLFKSKIFWAQVIGMTTDLSGLVPPGTLTVPISVLTIVLRYTSKALEDKV